jgi:uncharacterized membrane protein HdeD (DUF308 family)
MRGLAAPSGSGHTPDMAMVDTRPGILAELRKNWGWLLAWGVVLVTLGVVGLGNLFAVSVVTAFFVGLLMVAYGVVEAIQAFRHRGWSGFFLFFFGGVLSIVAGLVVLMNPMGGLSVLTLFVAMYFIALGVLRIVAVLSARHPGWGWGFLNGIVSLVLGVMIWNRWPASSLWIVGMFVCIDMIFEGWNYVMLALVARKAGHLAAGAAAKAHG